MFCAQCGEITTVGDRFCGHCGAHLAVVAQPSQDSKDVESAAPPVLAQATPIVTQVRPWVRYWARMFDIWVAAFVSGIAVSAFNPNAFTEEGEAELAVLVFIFAWVFIEPLLLSTTGTTPGKWLLRVRLIPPSGEKLDYSTVLSRSYKVWWRGLGTGFPLVSLVTLLVAYKKLTNNGTTSWDREGGFTVVHEDIGLLRVIFAVIFFIGVLLLDLVGS